MRTLMLAITGLIVAIFILMQWVAPQWATPKDGTIYRGKAAIGGDFTMTDQHGAPFTQAQLQGKWSILYFGFTHCPDICPTGLLIIANAMNDLPANLQPMVQPIFVSVDPERDTQELLANYVENFHPSLVGLHGTAEQTKQIADAYKVFYTKTELPDSALGYVVDHSGYMYLMSPKGEYVSHFPHNVSQQELTSALLKHIKSQP